MGKDERRLAAIMFTDMVGYSALAQKDERLAHVLLEEHRAILRPLFQKYDGQEVKTTGDGFLIEFPSPLGAVNCGIEIQGHLNTHNLTVSEERKLSIRIGIHLGEVEQQDDDLYGDGVNIAARIEPLAAAGGISISESVFLQVKAKLKLEVVSMGSPELKNISTPIQIYKIVLPWESTGSATAQSQDLGVRGQERINSIAVLPFVDMSPEGDNEYFSDGMTEELIDALAQIESLKVISRTSAFAFKGEKVDLKEVGARLGVDSILEGSIRKANDRLRITAQLINVKDDSHLWSERFDRELGDIFDIQEEIAQSIVENLEHKMETMKDNSLVSSSSKSLEAYQLYLRGRFFWNKRTKTALEKALQCFESALQIDRNYALAHSGIADCYLILRNLHFIPDTIGFEKARASAERAMEIDDSLAEVHASLALVSMSCDWNFVDAERYFLNAIQLRPGYAAAHHWYSLYLMPFGRTRESLKQIRLAQSIDPLSSMTNSVLGFQLYRLRQFDEAMEELNKALEMDPDFPNTHHIIGFVKAAEGRLEEAISSHEHALKLANGWFPMTEALIGNLHAQLGQIAESERILERFENLPEYMHISPYWTSIIYVGRGDYDKAFECLERAYVQKSDSLLLYLNKLPLFDALTSDARYVALLEKMGQTI